MRRHALRGVRRQGKCGPKPEGCFSLDTLTCSTGAAVSRRPTPALWPRMSNGTLAVSAGSRPLTFEVHKEEEKYESEEETEDEQ